MTPQPQHPDDLFMITRDELDRCCSQMSAAGYKVSANYVEAMVLSRPAPSPSESEITNKILRMVESDEWQKEHDATIAAKAREEVLDAIMDCAETDGEWWTIDGTDFLYINYSVLSKKAESLRTEGGDE